MVNYEFTSVTRGRESERGRDAASFTAGSLPFGSPFWLLFLLKSPSCAPFAPTKSKSYAKSVPWLQSISFFVYFSKKSAPRSRPLSKCIEKTQFFSMFSLLSPSRPRGAKWDPKVSQMGALGAQSGAKWSQVSAKGLPGRAKVPQNRRKSTPQERSFSPEAPRDPIRENP